MNEDDNATRFIYVLPGIVRKNSFRKPAEKMIKRMYLAVRFRPSISKVFITGNQYVVEEAVECLQSFLRERFNIVSTEVEVPSKYDQLSHGQCVNLFRRLSNPSFVEVEFHSSENTIIIHGVSDDVNEVKEVVLGDFHQATKILQNHNYGEKLKDYVAHSEAMNRNFRNLNLIASNSNAKMNVRKKKKPGKKQPKQFLLEVFVESRLMKILAKTKRRQVKNIAQITGTQLTFPKALEEGTIMFISGIKERVDEAEERLQRLIEKIKKTVKFFVYMHPKYYAYFKLQSIDLTREFAEDFEDVCVSFPKQKNQNDSLVSVMGIRNRVKQAIKEMQNIVLQLATIITHPIEISLSLHDALYSTSNKFNAIIHGYSGLMKFLFPMPETGSNKIIMKGAVEDFKKVKTKFMIMATEMITYMMYVRFESELLQSFIGKNGDRIIQLCKRINVQFSRPLENAIKIVGKYEDIKKVVDKLEIILRQINKSFPRKVLVKVDEACLDDIFVHHPVIVFRMYEIFPDLTVSYPILVDPTKLEVIIRSNVESLEEATTMIDKLIPKVFRRFYEKKVFTNPRVPLTCEECRLEEITKEYRAEIRFQCESGLKRTIVVVDGHPSEPVFCRNYFLSGKCKLHPKHVYKQRRQTRRKGEIDAAPKFVNFRKQSETIEERRPRKPEFNKGSLKLANLQDAIHCKMKKKYKMDTLKVCSTSYRLPKKLSQTIKFYRF